MNSHEWIVCERTNRWASALRTALLREGEPLAVMPRLYEVRNLGDLSERLAERPEDLVLFEVCRGDLCAALTWLADAQPRYTAAQFAALVDPDLRELHEIRPHQHDERQQVVAALAEAGACDFALSPRQLDGVLNLGRRHAERLAARSTTPENLAIKDWAWAQLPWQGQ